MSRRADELAAEPDPATHRRGVSGPRQAWSAVAAVVVLVTLTLGLQAADDSVSTTIVFLTYLAAVVGLSAAGGTVVGVGAAVAAFLVVNFYFSDPVRTFDVADPERLAELLIFLGVSATVAVLVDTATRRREVIEVRTAQARELAAANDLRIGLLRAVSHDLRTPLTTAKMATSSLLASDVELAPEARTELVELADGAMDRLILIVENLLDAGRLQAEVMRVDLSPVDLADVARAAAASIDGTDQARVELAVEESLPPVLADAALLQRVVANLVTNALNADPSGRITVLAAAGDQGRVVLDVVDHGPGMTEEQRLDAFLPFHSEERRGEAGGIGLGLTICAGFCEAMDASLDLLPTPGTGLTARIGLAVEP